MRALDTIYIHASATPRGAGVTTADIRRWHMNKKPRGWADIGYHIVIEDDGSINAGRPLSKMGAHAYPQNRGSVGVCYTGGLHTNGKGLAGPNKAQQVALRAVCETLMASFPTITRVLGHRDMGARKDCPCFDVAHWWQTGEMIVSRNLA